MSIKRIFYVIIFSIFIFFLSTDKSNLSVYYQARIEVEGRQLLLNGEPFTVKGVVYSPVPIGKDPETHPPYGDYFTTEYSAIYNRDLPILRYMGANTIRIYKWNNTADHSDFLDKAYNNGVNPIYVIAGFWIDPGLDIDPYSPQNVREEIKAAFREMVAIHKNHPAILMWSIGNDLNALSMYGNNLDDLFSLIDEMAEVAHSEEGANYHPVTTALLFNDDLVNTIYNYDPYMIDIDVWGINTYHGQSFGTLFSEYEEASSKPLIILEYGIDAYDNAKMQEDEQIQAEYAEILYREITANSDVCIGGTIRAYSDEWWRGKYSTDPSCPDNDPAIHSACGHSNPLYPDNYYNEEWSGIMRTTDNDSDPDIMEPRLAYYVLQSLWNFDSNTTGDTTSTALSPNVAAYYATAYDSANADWNAHRWEDALIKYKLITKTASHYASKAHIQIGKYYKYHGDWDKAIAEYENAIAKATEIRDIEDAETSIAAVYMSRGDFSEALSIFRSVIFKTHDWQQVKYCTYWIKELKRQMSFGHKTGCNECGPKVIREALRTLNIEITEEDISKMKAIGEGKASFEDLKKIAESKGINAKGAKITLNQLRTIKKPVVALIKPEHYVLVTETDENTISYKDPSLDNKTFTLKEKDFTKRWDGYVLVLFPEDTKTVTALLTEDEMKNLKGGVCYCCPESNNGTQTPNTEFKVGCVNPTFLVNTVNLNLAVQDTDLSYGGRGPDVVITRTYNADDSRDGPFGHSWTFNYNVTVTENPIGGIDVRRETGTIHHYTYAGNGNYYPPNGVYDTLIKNADNTYSLKLKGSKLTQHFNSSGKLTSITDRNGNSITLQYDDNGNLTTITDAVGRVTTLSYGPNGKIASITDPLGRTVNYSYDANNNLISVTNMAGNTVTHNYDENSYMTAITTLKGTTTITYNTSSDGYALESITDPLGNTESYGTHDTHYEVRIVNANGNSIYYENNYDGYTEKITDALGNAVIYGYDSYGNKNSIQDANGNTTSLAYDSNGNITSITNPLSNMVQFTYDTNDNLISLIDPAGNVTSYEYDANDNLTKITDAQSGQTTFTYNSYGELLTLTDANNNSYQFSYDSSGNLVSVTNPAGGVDSYTYDGVGRVISHTDPNGNTFSYTYDGIDRLKTVTYPDGSTKTYTYDCCGISSITDKTGTIAFEYDDANRLKQVTDVYGNLIQYDYDNAGNLTSITYPDGKVVQYTYDEADRLIKVTDWLNNVTTYEYDSAGNLIKTIYPDGSTIVHQYDNANRLKSILDFKADATVNAVFNYTLDSLGNRTKITFYQPLNSIPSTPNINYTYNTDNRLLTAGSTTFNYDNNGNLISKTIGNSVTNFTWDYNNMLTQLVNSSNTYSYKYDGLGNRIAKIVNGVETRYVIDPSGALSSILAETDSSGSITTYYVYGLGLISKITPAGQAYYYHYDGIGSTIAITDLSGNIVNKYAYDAFGRVLSQTETVSNPFKYVGRFGVMDEGNGLLYMRARYYDPEIGRFINKDPIGFAGRDVNLYAYVGNNPVNRVDLLGLSDCDIEEELNSDCYIEEELSSIATPIVIFEAAFALAMFASISPALTGAALVDAILIRTAAVLGVDIISKAFIEFMRERIKSRFCPNGQYFNAIIGSLG